ncbi:MAG: glutaminyl-peptide cyclotransferase [Halioglobus sp.]|nr:glutaminyl-peptide cyclotransferase [Halioglobus sp.]
MNRYIQSLAFAACFTHCLSAAALDYYDARVLEKRPQSREHFVQGLEIVDDALYVSTGTYGASALYRYAFPGGELEARRAVDKRIFAEGLTVLDNYVYQLTWRNRRMLVYERATLKPLFTLPLPGEGCGLTNNGEALIYSDGSATLRFIAPVTGKYLRSVNVTLKGEPLRLLNELEWIDGSVWANVWGTETIVVIDPQSGRVTAQINLGGLLPQEERRPDTDVLNGIARDASTGDIWVTGKRWPWLYRIELLPRGENTPDERISRQISR